MPRRQRLARAVPAAARVAYEPASTRYQTGPFPLCGTGVTSAGTPPSAARRSACARALSSDAYAASRTVQPSVSRRAGAGAGGGWWWLVEVVDVAGEVTRGAGAAGGATNASRARASRAHPPTASAATTSAATATRNPRRGCSVTGVGIAGGDGRGFEG